MKVPVGEAARLRAARMLLNRFTWWHSNIPDEPPYPVGSLGRLVQQTRQFLVEADPPSGRQSDAR